MRKTEDGPSTIPLFFRKSGRRCGTTTHRRRKGAQKKTRGKNNKRTTGTNPLLISNVPSGAQGKPLAGGNPICLPDSVQPLSGTNVKGDEQVHAIVDLYLFQWSPRDSPRVSVLPFPFPFGGAFVRDYWNIFRSPGESSPHERKRKLAEGKLPPRSTQLGGGTRIFECLRDRNGEEHIFVFFTGTVADLAPGNFYPRALRVLRFAISRSYPLWPWL